MNASKSKKTVVPTPIVEDPHPGSISDGTHPAAMEHKQPKATRHNGDANRVPGTASKPDVDQHHEAGHSQAPRHPNKGAFGS